MVTPSTEACLVVIGLESIAGFFSSSFIIFCLIFTSFKERKVTSRNYILISLSISNACFTVVSSTNFTIGYVWPWLFSLSNVFYVMYYIDLCSLDSLAWLTSVLCFFYFIKIRQFQPGFLAWVKVNIDTMVPWMILTVVFVSVLGSYFSILLFDLGLPKNSTHAAADMSLEHQKRRMNLIKPSLMISFLPFIVSLVSLSGTAWFLRQQRSAGKLGSAKGKDYQSAVNIMICFVSFYALIYLFFALYGLQIFAIRSWGYWICALISYSFAAIQSGLIIRGNPKLRDAWRQLFRFKYILHH